MHKFKDKHLLIDTNLLIAISKYSGDGFFDNFLKKLENQNIKSVIEEATLFEFRRGSRKQSHLDDKNQFLNFLFGGEKNKMILQSSTSKEILNNAEKLAIIYSHKNPNLSKQISFVDCLVASQLMKYKNNLYLATIDNNDYPLFIFNRDKLVTIDTKKEIINIGIYSFNEEKYQQCLADFKKA
ncbi:PIN domain-containing protein [Patescibacteria group bacterium]|nr:PIN domain-containing protein [Patescibacteria group bacterium]